MDFTMRYFLSAILIVVYVFAGNAQESVSIIESNITDKEVREILAKYESFYNDRLYIKDGKPDYHIVNTLFTGDLQIKNDFSANRPEKLSLKDYIRFLEEHYDLGVHVKFSDIRIISDRENDKERSVVISYNKENFSYYDNKEVVLKIYQERLSIIKNNKGQWRISNIELIVPPFISADLSASIFYPGFSLNRGGGNTEIGAFKQEDRISYSIGIGLEYNLNDHISFSAGFNYSFYNITLSANSVKQDDVLSTDKDLEEYYLIAEGYDISDDIELSYFSIPILFKYYFLPEKKVSPFVGAGGEVFINSSARSSMHGRSTQEGYYPQYHVLLYDIPELGFLTDYSFSHTQDITVSKSFFAAEIFAGARIQLFKDKIYGMLRIYYKPGLTNMIDAGDYMFATKAQEYNSLLYANDKVMVNSFGLNFGVKFKIK